jgi:drug/metabolite transporter (DMT)-like permease
MWALLSIIAGFADASRDALSKRAAGSIPRDLITWSYSLLALPLFIPVLLYNLPDSIPSEFWIFLAITSSLHTIGGLMLVKALQSSDLSLCTPMVAFTPVFLLVIGPLLTGDSPNAAGIIGAILVALGSYVLNLSKTKYGVFAPIKALYQEQGSRLMLALALLWSVTGSIDRVAVQRFHLIFWASAQLCAIAVLLIPIVARSGSLRVVLTPRFYPGLLSLGALNALSLVTYLIGLLLAPVYYVICLKRSSILFSVLLGRLMFGESLVADRLPGALLMLAGVVVITLWS